jgi:uncharacterized membrane protein
MLARYNQTLPGLAERVVVMAENQSKHRQKLEEKVVDSNCSSQRRGQVYGFIIILIVVVGGMYLIHEGKSVQGLVAILGALTSVLAVFLYGKVEQKKELARKASQFPQKP